MSTAPETMEIASPIRNHVETRAELDVLRTGIETYETDDGDTRTRKKPAHMINRDVVTTVYNHLVTRGEFFCAPYPYYLDKTNPELMRRAAGRRCPGRVRLGHPDHRGLRLRLSPLVQDRSPAADR
jgi:hypothetical protein